MKGKVLFLDRVHPVLAKRMKTMGFECEEDYSSSYADLMDKIDNYEGLVIRSRIRLDKKILERGKKLEFIARSGAGLENIDVEYAKQRKIEVINSPEGNRDAVGEHALGMLLSLFNHLCRGNEEVRRQLWKREENRGLEIKGKTVGILGFGNMGSAFAEKLKGLGCKVIAFDKYKSGYGNEMVEEVNERQLFRRTDILSLHIPLSEETHHLVNAHYLSNFEKDIYLINTARGSHVKTTDLLKCLDSGKVKGACLDVLEVEKRSFETLKEGELPSWFNDLAGRKNVMLSPHVAGWTVESYYKLSDILAKKIQKKYGI